MQKCYGVSSEKRGGENIYVYEVVVGSDCFIAVVGQVEVRPELCNLTWLPCTSVLLGVQQCQVTPWIVSLFCQHNLNDCSELVEVELSRGDALQ